MFTVTPNQYPSIWKLHGQKTACTNKIKIYFTSQNIKKKQLKQRTMVNKIRLHKQAPGYTMNPIDCMTLQERAIANTNHVS